MVYMIIRKGLGINCFSLHEFADLVYIIVRASPIITCNQSSQGSGKS